MVDFICERGKEEAEMTEKGTKASSEDNSSGGLQAGGVGEQLQNDREQSCVGGFLLGRQFIA